MKPNIIHSLRKQGYWVKVSHKRLAGRGEWNEVLGTKKEIKEYFGDISFCIHSKGGVTIMEIVNPQRTHYFTSTSFCNEKDSFVRKLGLVRCLGRIAGQMARAGVMCDDLLAKNIAKHP